MIFKSINPYTGEVIGEYPVMHREDIARRIEKATQAFSYWKTAERVSKMSRLGDLLLKDKSVYALLITSEMGKTLKESEAEAEKCASTIQYYVDNVGEFLKPLSVAGSSSYVRFDPLGPLLAIMPWNFPFWQVMRFAIPTIISGNVVLLKHAPNVSGCALALEKLFTEAGFPDGVFQSVTSDVDNIEMIIGSPDVRGVTLTGSNRAGSSVAALAGKYIKKSVLELGGSDPFIVLKDADILLAAETAVKSRFQNAGQTCIAAKRWIVESAVAEQFENEVVRLTKALRQGDPTDPETDLGPLARIDLAENLDRQIKWLTSRKNELIWGGEHSGCNFQPSLIRMKKTSDQVFNEETFGPVACIYTAGNEEEAINMANETSFGLGASLWTRDIEKAHRIASGIDSGFVAVNSMVKSDARLPFGGVKQSGYGRELSYFGIHEFVNIKSVWM